ncbi:MAG TPA: hypothetical protein VF376_04100 [Thermoanaerobaculia bacterium]
MKTILVAMIGMPSILGFVPASLDDDCAAPPATAVSSPAKRESPLACDRMALSDAERTRHFDELGPALRKLKKSVRELPDGYEFEFSADRASLALVEEWVAGERVCCPFFDITLRLEREGGPMWLRLTGREGVKHFIEVDGAAWIKS